MWKQKNKAISWQSSFVVMYKSFRDNRKLRWKLALNNNSLLLFSNQIWNLLSSELVSLMAYNLILCMIRTYIYVSIFYTYVCEGAPSSLSLRECATNAASVWRPALKAEPQLKSTESAVVFIIVGCYYPGFFFCNDSHFWKQILWMRIRARAEPCPTPSPRPGIVYDLSPDHKPYILCVFDHCPFGPRWSAFFFCFPPHYYYFNYSLFCVSSL